MAHLRIDSKARTVMVLWMEIWDLHDSDSIIVKDRGHVFGREFIRGVTDQQTSLSDSTIAHHDTSIRSSISCSTLNS